MIDNPIADLLQQHLNGVDVSDQLAGLLQDDPQLAPMAQLLAHREQHLQTQIQSQDDHEGQLQAQIELRDLDDQLQRQARDIEQLNRQQKTLREQVERMNGEVDRLQATLDPVAAALGACPACLGDNADCPLCRGRGVPGTLPPDPECFRSIVWPAVRAHSYRRSRTVRGQRDTEGRSA